MNHEIFNVFHFVTIHNLVVRSLRTVGMEPWTVERCTGTDPGTDPGRLERLTAHKGFVDRVLEGDTEAGVGEGAHLKLQKPRCV